MQLLRTIFIIILAYYVINFMSRFLIPWFTRYFLKRTFRNMEQRQRPNQAKTKNGEVNIDYQPEKKQMTKDVGEYIDYEEVDEQ